MAITAIAFYPANSEYINNDVNVVIGQHDLNNTDGFEQNIAIDKIIIHPFYDAFNHHDYDVALLKMKTNITYNDRVRPICLPTQDYPAGSSCYITGWGHLKESGHGPWVLHQVGQSYSMDHNEKPIEVSCRIWIDGIVSSFSS